VQWVSRLQEGATAVVRRQRGRRDWLDHLLRAGTRYKAVNGDYLAAAITYYSFLSLFPLLLLVMSVAGFILHARQDLLDELIRRILETIPGVFGGVLVDAVKQAVQHRGAVGAVGVLLLAYAGMGWIGNLRKAVMIIWETDRRKQPNLVVSKGGDLLALVGVGAVSLVSLALTAVATAATGWFLRITGLDGVTGMGVLSTVLGLLIAVAGDTLVFGWLLARLPRIGVPFRNVLKGAVFAAFGFSILKVVGTYYAQRVSHSPTVGIFGTVIGTLIWLNLTARFLLYAAAWTACDQIFAEGVPPPLLGLSTEADQAADPATTGPGTAGPAATGGQSAAGAGRDREATV
jgi:membrane protein